MAISASPSGRTFCSPGSGKPMRHRWKSAWPRSGSRHGPAAHARGLSPVPAIPAANSRSPTPRAWAWRSPNGSNRALSSTRPSTSTSRAQHYIGDIGLLACRVPIDATGEDTIEGFHIFIGGGFGADAGIARELYRNMKAQDCPDLIAQILEAYLRHRAGAEETFVAFARRHDVDALKGMIEALPREAA